MRVKVIKPFPFAESRQNTRQVEAGEVLTIADEDVLGGLFDAGYVEQASDAVDDPAQPVDIPADWETLHFFKLQALAAQIAGTKPKDKEASIAVIKAELARRAGA